MLVQFCMRRIMDSYNFKLFVTFFWREYLASMRAEMCLGPQAKRALIWIKENEIYTPV